MFNYKAAVCAVYLSFPIYGGISRFISEYIKINNYRNGQYVYPLISISSALTVYLSFKHLTGNNFNKIYCLTTLMMFGIFTFRYSFSKTIDQLFINSKTRQIFKSLDEDEYGYD